MAKYTTELLSIVYAYSDTGKTLTERINQANQQYIFAFPYPIWDDAYKSTLERKIVMHYLRREMKKGYSEEWVHQRLLAIRIHGRRQDRSTLQEGRRGEGLQMGKRWKEQL